MTFSLEHPASSMGAKPSSTSQPNTYNRRTLQALASQAAAGASRNSDATASKGRRAASIALTTVATAVIALTVYSQWDGEPEEKTHPAHDAAEALTSTQQMSWAAGDSGHRSTASAQVTSTEQPRPNGGSSITDTPAALEQPADDEFEDRIRPIEALALRRDGKAVRAVIGALEDDDWRMRSRALDAAVNAYVPIPEETLIERAQSDPSPEVRFLALAGLAARVDSPIPEMTLAYAAHLRAISKLALNDASEPVRWQAQQILDALDAASQPLAASDQSQAQVQ